jgi:tetratricopeptide (TPR) repeat protein
MNALTFLRRCLLLTAFVCAGTGIQAMSSADSIRWLMQQSRFDETIRITQRLQQAHQSTAETFYMEGLALKNLYRFAPAIRSFQKSYETDTLRSEILSELGSCYKSLNDYGRALSFYEKALRKTPLSSGLMADAANAYMMSEKYERALELYRSLYKNEPLNVYFLRNIARCYDYMGNEDSAIVSYEKCLYPINGDYQSTYRLCSLWLKKKAYDQALSLIARYMFMDSTNARINSLNAYLYMMKHEYPEAKRLFLRCYSNHDESKFTLKYLGITSFKLDDMESAKTYLEKAYKIDSADYEVTNFLGIACSSSVYKRQGIYYLNKTLSLITPDSIYLGNIYGNLGKAYDAYSNAPCEKALASYLRALELNPADTLCVYLIAKKYDDCLKNKTMAVKYYRQFIDMLPARKKSEPAEPNVISLSDLASRRLKELTQK